MNEFNIRQIGQRIASKRRELNMTQSNLADQLLVSYQAISNWERGNTLPDIEKLPQLATILQLSIDELLGNSGVAVMHYHEGVADSQEITTLAPIIKPKELAAATQAQPFELELVEQLAPFLSSEELFALLKPITEPLTEEALEEFLPFLETDHLEQLMKEDYAFAFLEEAAPYLSATFLAQKVEQAVSNSLSLYELEDIAPFLEKQDLGRILQKILAASENPEQRLSELEDLLPFLDESTLVTLVGYFPVSSEVFELFTPFLATETLLQALRKKR